MKYFAYGSNMLEERLKSLNCTPDAVFHAIGSVRRNKLQFHKRSDDGSGKCNIIETNAERDVVYGVIFEVPDDQLEALDRAEGVGHGYHRDEYLVVRLADDTELLALAYVADQNATNDHLFPYAWYRRLVIAGAEQHRLPEGYIAKLKAAPYCDDLDPNRDTKQEAEAQLNAYYNKVATQAIIDSRRELAELWEAVKVAAKGEDSSGARSETGFWAKIRKFFKFFIPTQFPDGANPVLAVGWCLKAERALDQEKPDIAAAHYAIVVGTHQLKRAQELRRTRSWVAGFVASIVGILWLIGLCYLMITQPWAQFPKALQTFTFAGVPTGTLIAGALGGTLWNIYFAASWTKRRLFNPYYLTWHLMMPVVGAFSGGILSAALQAGFLGLSIDASQPSGQYGLLVVSFIAGFYSDRILDLFTPIFSKIFGTHGAGGTGQTQMEQIQREGEQQL